MRTTVALDEKLYRALKMKAASTASTVSDLIADAIRHSLKEDAIDTAAFEERKAERPRPFEEALKELKRDGLI